MNKPSQILLASLGLALVPAAAMAQFSQANQQVDSVLQQQQATEAMGQSSTTNTVPELYPDETTDVGIQSILRVKPRRQILQASADLQYFYTDNALYTTHHAVDSDVLVGTVQAALAPTPFALGDGFLALRLGFQQQWYNYGLAVNNSFSEYDNASQTFSTKQLSDLDFNAQTVFADETWRWQNWLLGTGVDYRRLLDSTEYQQFYSEVVPRWSVQRLFALGKTTGLSLSYQGTIRVTRTTLTAPGLDASSGNRTDQSFMVAGSWKLCSHAMLQPYYRFELSHYTGIHRDDYLNSFGLALICPITRQFSFRAFAGYDNLRTDGFEVQSYQNLTAGGGLNLTVSF